jgi:hypothetical protein
MWYFGVRPMEQKLAAKTVEFRSVSAELNEFEQTVATEQPIAAAIEAMTAEARKINGWTAKSGDPARLYDAFHGLATQCGVRIERVEPTAAHGALRKDPQAPEAYGYAIEVTGGYQAVAKFMDACEQDLGVTKITSFHMSPTGGIAAAGAGDPSITAMIETSHLKLAIPGVGDVSTSGHRAAKAAESGS